MRILVLITALTISGALSADVNFDRRLKLSLQGDISSSGDENPQGNSPDALEKAMDFFESKTLLNCMLTKSPLMIEITQSFDSWGNEGYLRISAPRPTGGMQVLFLERYTRITHIDPRSNEVTVNVAASSKVEQRDNVTLRITLNPVQSKLKVSGAEFTIDLKGLTSAGSSSRKEISCKWGRGKTTWD